MATTPDTRTHVQRVAELVAGFESPFGLELLSTVHWVVTREGAHSFAEVVNKAYGWNDRKKAFTRRQIELACQVLHEKGWLTDSTASPTKTQRAGASE